MALSALAIHDYLEANSGITNLIGTGHIWLNLAGDGSTLPFIVLTQVSQVPTYHTAGKRIEKLTLQVDVYAATLASVDTITTAVQSALTINAAVTGNAWGLLLKNGPNPMVERGGAYRSTTEYLVWEDLS